MLTREEEKEMAKIQSHCRKTYVTQREVIRLQELQRKADLPYKKLVSPHNTTSA